MAEPTKPQLQVHPLIASLTQTGQQPEPAVKFAGYVGPSSQPGKVRLYSTLDDLSHYLEFDESAVMQTAPAPQDLLPDNAVSVWVKGSTSVRWIREYPTASGFASTIANSLAQGRGAGANLAAGQQSGF
jgi:hypothetical protein